MNTDLLQRLKDRLKQPGHGSARPEIEAGHFDKLSETCGIPIPACFRETFFLICSSPLASLEFADAPDSETCQARRTCADLTKSFRNDHWPGTENWLVFATDGSGNPIGFDNDGRIWISDHLAGSLGCIAADFESFLEAYVLKDTEGFNYLEELDWASDNPDRDETTSKAVDLFLEKKFAEALPLFHRAAEMECGLAMSYLGQMYRSSKGTDKDRVQSYKWHELAYRHKADKKYWLAYLTKHNLIDEAGIEQAKFEVERFLERRQ